MCLPGEGTPVRSPPRSVSSSRRNSRDFPHFVVRRCVRLPIEKKKPRKHNCGLCGQKSHSAAATEVCQLQQTQPAQHSWVGISTRKCVFCNICRKSIQKKAAFRCLHCGMMTCTSCKSESINNCRWVTLMFLNPSRFVSFMRLFLSVAVRIVSDRVLDTCLGTPL